MKQFQESMIIGEEDFSEQMEKSIGPWVGQCLRDGYCMSGDGTKIHYHCAVHPQERAAVVISHGFCEFVCKYYEVMYYFYQMGYSVFLLEYRGHGFSQRFVEEMDRVYVRDYREYVDDLHGFMEQVVTKESLTKEYLLFAHSMGGCIGSLFLEQYPQYFRAAVLSAPMLQMNFRDVPEWAVSLLVLWSRIARWDLRYVPGQKGFDGVYAFATSSCTSEARYAYVFARREEEPHYQSYGGTYAWTRASIRAIRQVHKHADQIRIPVLLFQAGLDGMVKPAGQEAFVRETAQTQLVRFETSKHEIFNATEDVRREYYKRIFAFFEPYGKTEKQA